MVIIVAAFLLRLMWGVSLPTDAAATDRLPDQREYLSLGRNLLLYGTLSFVDPRFDQRVYAFRLPGYPMLVAACGGNVRVIRVVQAAIDTSTVVAAGLLAWMVFGSAGAGCAAAALVAVNPWLIYFSGLVLSDTLFTALLAWGLVLLARRQTVAGAALLVCSAMVRPPGLLLALALPGAAAFGASRSMGSIARATLVALIFVAVALLPWAARNHARLNSWIIGTTNTGLTLYDGLHDGATGASDQRFIATMPELRSMGEIERSTVLTHRAVDWVRHHTGPTFKLAVTKLARFWSPVPLSAEFGRRLYAIAGGAYAIPLDLLAALGLIRYRRAWRQWATIALTIVYFSLLHAATVGSLRYRLPIEPLLGALAAGGIAASEEPECPQHPIERPI